MLQKELQLEIWSFIIQKSSVITSSLMALLECPRGGYVLTQYSSAGGEGLLIQTLIPNQSQSPQIHQTAHMPLTTRLVPLQSTGCRMQRKYVGKFARNPLQAGSEILLGNGKLSRGKFWFCQHGGGRAGGSIVLFIALFTLVAFGERNVEISGG